MRTLGQTLADGFAYCAAPLFCGPTQRCIERPRLGESCNSRAEDLCSVGAVCDVLASGACVAAKPVGAMCTGPSECEGYLCRGGACRWPTFSVFVDSANRPGGAPLPGQRDTLSAGGGLGAGSRQDLVHDAGLGVRVVLGELHSCFASSRFLAA